MDKEIQTFGRQEQLFAGNGESTDLALMVDALAQEERSPWDASRIRDALMVEAGTDPATAESIAEAGGVHGINFDELVHQLNEYLAEQQ